MKVLIDTNVLISAALSSSGTPYKAFVKAVTLPNQGVISEQNVDEMRRIFNKKFPDKIKALDKERIAQDARSIDSYVVRINASFKP